MDVQTACTVDVKQENRHKTNINILFIFGLELWINPIKGDDGNDELPLTKIPTLSIFFLFNQIY